MDTWKTRLTDYLLRFFEKVNIILSPNAGRDWGGFLRLIKTIPDDTDLIWLCHCKKSPRHTYEWMNNMYEPFNSIRSGRITLKWLQENYPSVNNEYIICSNKHRDGTYPSNAQNYCVCRTSKYK